MAVTHVVAFSWTDETTEADVAGMLASGMDRDSRVRLFIDVGTNCEIALSDGERIVSADPIVGYMHRGAEKLFEVRDYRQITVLANRHDWLSAFGNELGVVLAAEHMLGMEIPERATWARTLLGDKAPRVKLIKGTHLLLPAAVEPGVSAPAGFGVEYAMLRAMVAATLADGVIDAGERQRLDGAVAVHKVSELPAGQGLNADTLSYGDLVADGVIDPVKVTRSALANAASIAALVLTTETLVADKPADEDEHQH